MALHAILTAGGTLPKALRRYSSSTIKALLPVAGRTLLETAALAARASGVVERIAAVGGEEVERSSPPEVEYVREGLDVVDNIWNGFLALGGEEHEFLVISPDLPFISGDGLAQLAAGARSAGAGIAFPIIARDCFIQRFPGAPNRFELLDGKRVTMGSAIYLTGGMLKANIPLGRDFYRYRKLPHKLALLLGWPVVFSFIIQRLRCSQLEARAASLTGGCVRGVYVSDAGLAYDIDNEANYRFAVEILGRPS